MGSINILKLEEGDIVLINKRSVTDGEAHQLIDKISKLGKKNIGVVWLNNIEVGQIKGCSIEDFMKELKKGNK